MREHKYTENLLFSKYTAKIYSHYACIVEPNLFFFSYWQVFRRRFFSIFIRFAPTYPSFLVRQSICFVAGTGGLLLVRVLEA